MLFKFNKKVIRKSPLCSAQPNTLVFLHTLSLSLVFTKQELKIHMQRIKLNTESFYTGDGRYICTKHIDSYNYTGI